MDTIIHWVLLISGVSSVDILISNKAHRAHLRTNLSSRRSERLPCHFKNLRQDVAMLFQITSYRYGFVRPWSFENSLRNTWVQVVDQAKRAPISTQPYTIFDFNMVVTYFLRATCRIISWLISILQSNRTVVSNKYRLLRKKHLVNKLVFPFVSLVWGFT